jgi:hypothetical protein
MTSDCEQRWPSTKSTCRPNHLGYHFSLWGTGYTNAYKGQ